MSIDPTVADRIRDVPLSAHLATSVDDRPHVAPVWYVYDDATDPEAAPTVSLLTGGKKLSNLRRNPRVALSIESYDANGVNWGVQCLGTARVVDDPDRIAEVQHRLDEIYAGPYGADGGTVTSELDRQAEANADADATASADRSWGLVEVSLGSASMQSY